MRLNVTVLRRAGLRLVIVWSLLFSAAFAQKLDMAWTRPYAEALEKKEGLVLLKAPLENTLTRMELVTWITQVFGLTANTKKIVPISDLPKDSPDFLNAQAFIQAGLGSAPKGKFNPQGDYTRLEALALFARALKLQAPTKETTQAWIALYKDSAQLPAQGKQFVAAAAAAGLVVNVPDPAEIGPDYVVTRGEGMVFLYQSQVYRQKATELNPPVAQRRLDPPALTAIEVTPKNATVRPGETVTVTAKGTPGSQAVFSLGDLVSNAPLKESSPGIYTGTYKVRTGDYLANPAVSVGLNRAGLEDRKQKIAVITIGTDTVASVPEEDPYTAPLPRPRGTYPPPDNSYYPPPSYAPPSNGRNNPDLYRPDFRRSGGSARDLSVPQDTAPLINQVGYTPSKGVAFRPGELIVVEMRGDVGGKATFEIDGYTTAISMKEEKPGFYKGSARVGKNLDIPNGTIRVTLLKNGRTTTESIPEQISVVSRGSSAQF